MQGILIFPLILIASSLSAQLQWRNVDSVFGPLPPSVHVYFTDQAIDTSAFRAYYLIADLKDKRLDFTTDTTLDRRLTPSQFYERNGQPLVVVNGTFFSFETNRNLNLVIAKGKTLAYGEHIKFPTAKDTTRKVLSISSAFGILKNGWPDVAWTYHKKGQRWPLVYENNPDDWITSGLEKFDFEKALFGINDEPQRTKNSKNVWQVKTAIGGGPVLLHADTIRITNKEEWKFTGKAINDKHPRTAMGYTKDNKLIILMVEGRNPQAGGATLTQEAQILKDLGCVEALNLDGGGSSCLLINGRETIKPSDKTGQRPVPAVFLIMSKQ